MFITIEGIDGCGKTTQVELLEKHLLDRNIFAIKVREPGGTSLSENIRKILLDNKNNINPVAELLLFEAARAQLVSEIISPAINNNTWVLSDRFFDSTLAYQGFGRGLNVDNINFLNKLAVQNLIPNITFYLKIPIKMAMKRRKNKHNDRIEAEDNNFIQKVADGFDALHNAEPDRIKIINAAQSIEETHNEILGGIRVYLTKNCKHLPNYYEMIMKFW